MPAVYTELQNSTGIRALTTKTWFSQPPVEWGRAGGAVKTIALGSATGDNGTGGGTDGVVDNKTATSDRPNEATGLKVDLTINSNVCTAIAVDAHADADGNGFRIGDKVTISTTDAGTTTPVVGYVTALEYED